MVLISEGDTVDVDNGEGGVVKKQQKRGSCARPKWDVVWGGQVRARIGICLLEAVVTAALV